MVDARTLVKSLQLSPHPEGGYYREIYRSDEVLKNLPARYSEERNISTSIYYMLESSQFSRFHKLKSDELWFYHSGAPMTLHRITPDGEHIVERVGQDQNFQLLIPREHWFAAEVEEPDTYSLISCVVAPGFDFKDFEIADREKLTLSFPDHKNVISRFTA